MKNLCYLMVTCCALALAGDVAIGAAALAEKYPDDRGIDRHPAVIFADDFEGGSLARWDDRSGSLVATNGEANGGQWSAEARMIRGKNQGGEAKKWFMPGFERVYVRLYIRFSTNYQYAHHFVSLMGNHQTNRWSSFGKAGRKPDGSYFSSGMEPWFAWGKNPSPGELNFYSYFIDMKPDPKMNRYWGNSFFPPGPEPGAAAGSARVLPKLGQWQCWEFMVQMNSSARKADGTQTMWLDGKQVAHFTGIRWRIDEAVKINCFWLQHYGYDESDPTRQFHGKEQTVWFDDVVIAREYIGPRVPNKKQVP